LARRANWSGRNAKIALNVDQYEMPMLNVQILKLMDVDRKNMGNNPDIKNCALDKSIGHVFFNKNFLLWGKRQKNGLVFQGSMATDYDLLSSIFCGGAGLLTSACYIVVHD